MGVNSENPASWLRPGEPLMAHGLDWSWCFIIFGDIPDCPGFKADSEGGIWTCWKVRAKAGLGRRAGTERYMTSEWRRIAGSPGNHGYLQAEVRDSSGRKVRKCIHDFVLSALWSKRPGKSYEYECRHLDGSRQHNRLRNLAWGTHQQNQMDRVAHGTSNRGSRHGMSKLDEETAVEIVRLYKGGMPVTSIAHRLEGRVKIRAVYCVLRGEKWAHVTGVTSPLTSH